MASRLSLAALAFTALLLASCGSKESGAPSGPGGPGGQMPTVTVAVPLIKPIVDWDDFIGRFEARQSVEIRPRVSGYVKSINFRDGEFARAGDLLFVIDPRPFQAALDQAVGTLAKDKSQLANAHALEIRWKKLFDEGIASKEDWDQYRTSADTSAGLVAADEAAAESARVQLSFATIRSPISGMTRSEIPNACGLR